MQIIFCIHFSAETPSYLKIYCFRKELKQVFTGLLRFCLAKLTGDILSAPPQKSHQESLLFHPTEVIGRSGKLDIQ